MIATKNKAKGDVIDLIPHRKIKEKKISIGLLVVFLCLNAIPAFAQGITLQLKNASLSEVFSSIEGQSSFNFFYNDQMVDKTHKVDVSVKNGSIEDILKTVLADFPLN